MVLNFQIALCNNSQCEATDISKTIALLVPAPLNTSTKDSKSAFNTS